MQEALVLIPSTVPIRYGGTCLQSQYVVCVIVGEGGKKNQKLTLILVYIGNLLILVYIGNLRPSWATGDHF